MSNAQPTRPTDALTPNRTDARDRVESAVTNRYSLDVLRVVEDEGHTDYDTIARRTPIARETVRKRVKDLVDAGVLARIGNPATVVFRDPETREATAAYLDGGSL